MKQQVSDRYIIGVLLALVGGFLDAYTYLARGHVFANAQTGNIVLLGVHMFEGNYRQVLYYMIPILSFVVGIFVVEYIRHFSFDQLHWRQGVILIEMFMVFIVAFLPSSLQMLSNCMISFVCAMQVQAFRKFNNCPYASTMCTGNLRSGTEALYQAIKQHNSHILFKSFRYYGIIFVFIIGALLGALSVHYLMLYAIMVVEIFLLIVFIMMFEHSL